MVLLRYPEMVWKHQAQLLLQWTRWKDPLCWCVWKTPCVTDVEPQRCPQHTSSKSLVGSMQYWWLCVQRPPHKYLLQLDLQVTPWQLLWFAQRIGFETGIICCSHRTPAVQWWYWLTRWFYLCNGAWLSALETSLPRQRSHDTMHKPLMD